MRKAIPGAVPEGSSSESVWGVLDGQISTDFPDIWSKTIVVHPKLGAVLIIPRERAMTRLYIELKADTTTGAQVPANVSSDIVMERARQICAPYKLNWDSVEWFGRYSIGQRVASKFMDDGKRAFIAGDASHTHSPKAAQGMNTSVHDSWNLAWKLNLELRGLAKPSLLESYELERKKIAHDLINFDYEHANQISAGDSEALAENFRTNIRFIAGIGVEYSQNILNDGFDVSKGAVQPGNILPPAKAVRYIDHNTISVQLDIPILGQFRIYVITKNVNGASEREFLAALSKQITLPTSLLSRLSSKARDSYAQKPRLEGAEGVYFRHERYTPISDLFTFALLSKSSRYLVCDNTNNPPATIKKSDFEIQELPDLFSQSPWTVYLDCISTDLCIEKWLGELGDGEVAIVNVRPDNYVGSISTWSSMDEEAGSKAAKWLESFYDGFLKV